MDKELEALTDKVIRSKRDAIVFRMSKKLVERGKYDDYLKLLTNKQCQSC